MHGRTGEENQNWLQRLIVQGLAIGIDKRALLTDYYPDELPVLFEAYAQLHGTARREPETETDVMTFLNL